MKKLFIVLLLAFSFFSLPALAGVVESLEPTDVVQVLDIDTPEIVALKPINEGRRSGSSVALYEKTVKLKVTNSFNQSTVMVTKMPYLPFEVGWESA